jgi:hypothetical protein
MPDAQEEKKAAKEMAKLEAAAKADAARQEAERAARATADEENPDAEGAEGGAEGAEGAEGGEGGAADKVSQEKAEQMSEGPTSTLGAAYDDAYDGHGYDDDAPPGPAGAGVAESGAESASQPSVFMTLDSSAESLAAPGVARVDDSDNPLSLFAAKRGS